MAKGRTVAMVLDEAEQRELTALTRKHGAPQSIAERARIVLAAAIGLYNKESVAKLGIFCRLQSTFLLQCQWGSAHQSMEGR